MPVQRGKSPLSQRLGNRVVKAHEEHKGDPIKMGRVDLPGGIKNGIARLASVAIAEHEEGQNKGKPYVSFQAIVREPIEFAGMRTRGLRATLFIPLYDTPTRSVETMEEHYAEVLNEIKKLGVDCSALNVDQVEAVMEALTKAKPYTRFSTRGWTPAPTTQDPNPKEMIFTQYDGVCDHVESEEEGDGVKDNTAAGKSGKGPPAKSPAKSPSSGESEGDVLRTLGVRGDEQDEDAQREVTRAAKKAGVDPNKFGTWVGVVDAILGGPGESGSEGEAGDAGADELDALAAAADDEGDEEAIAKLTEHAHARSIDPDAIETWVEVVALIRAADADGGGVEEPEAPIEPEKGKVYKAKPVGVRVPVECEVLAVNKIKKTVKLKNLDNDKEYANVPWDKLER